MHDKSFPQPEPKIRALLLDLTTTHGCVLVVVDQPKTIGALVIPAAQDLGVNVSDMPGLTTRKVADLHPGQAKTDARDAFVIANTARTLPHTPRGITVAEEDIAELAMLCGFDEDLAAQLTQVVTSMPGVGVRTAARILTEVVGKDFATAGHLASSAGIAPVTRRSGTSIRGESPSRRGNKVLKRALFLSAFASITASPASMAYYDRKRSEGKRHYQAVIARARRRTDVLYAMLRDGAFYTGPIPPVMPSRTQPLDETIEHPLWSLMEQHVRGQRASWGFSATVQDQCDVPGTEETAVAGQWLRKEQDHLMFSPELFHALVSALAAFAAITETRRLHLEKPQPYVAASLDPHEHTPGVIGVVVHNVGQTVVTNVQLDFTLTPLTTMNKKEWVAGPTTLFL